MENMNNKIIYKIGLSVSVGLIAMLLFSTAFKYYVTYALVNFGLFIAVSLIVFLFVSKLLEPRELRKKKNIIIVILSLITSWVVYNQNYFFASFLSVLTCTLIAFSLFQTALFCYGKIKNKEVL